MKTKEIIVFLFKGIPELICDEKGNFTYFGLPCKITYNNGTNQVRCNKFKFSKGVKSLRKLSYKDIVTEDVLPF